MVKLPFVSCLDKNDETTVEVFAGTLWEAEMVRSLLNDARLSNFMKNRLFNHFAHEPIKAEGVKVIVFSKDFTEAEIIVKNYINNIKQ